MYIVVGVPYQTVQQDETEDYLNVKSFMSLYVLHVKLTCNRGAKSEIINN